MQKSPLPAHLTVSINPQHTLWRCGVHVVSGSSCGLLDDAIFSGFSGDVHYRSVACNGRHHVLQNVDRRGRQGRVSELATGLVQCALLDLACFLFGGGRLTRQLTSAVFGVCCLGERDPRSKFAMHASRSASRVECVG